MGGRRRRTAPKRTLVGPLAMLAGGAVVGAAIWRFLMFASPPGVDPAERLSPQDHQTLDRVLHERARP